MVELVTIALFGVLVSGIVFMSQPTMECELNPPTHSYEMDMPSKHIEQDTVESFPDTPITDDPQGYYEE